MSLLLCLQREIQITLPRWQSRVARIPASHFHHAVHIFRAPQPFRRCATRAIPGECAREARPFIDVTNKEILTLSASQGPRWPQDCRGVRPNVRYGEGKRKFHGNPLNSGQSARCLAIVRRPSGSDGTQTPDSGSRAL